MPLTELFGGAITADFPSHLLDASDLRQIPDTQEVWLSKLSDLSLILEVLEFVEKDLESGEVVGVDGEKGVRYHFSSLAHDNAASSSSIISTSAPTSTPTSSPAPPTHLTGPYLLHGTQQISKFNLPSSASDTVSIRMALWRVREKNVDLVLSVNVPNEGGEGGKKKEEEEEENGVNGDHWEEKGGGEKVFDMVWKSLKVVDYGLFAG